MLTPEQIEERRGGVGGSDVAAICGFKQSRLQVYCEKLGL